MVWEKKPAFLLLQVLQSQKKPFFFCPLFFLHLSPSTVVDIGWGLAVNQRRKPGCTFWNTNIGVLCTFWSVNFGVLWYFAPFCLILFYLLSFDVLLQNTRSWGLFFWPKDFLNIWQIAHGWLVLSKSWILWVKQDFLFISLIFFCVILKLRLSSAKTIN